NAAISGAVPERGHTTAPEAADWIPPTVERRSAEAVVGDLFRDGRVRDAEEAGDLGAVAAGEFEEAAGVGGCEGRQIGGRSGVVEGGGEEMAGGGERAGWAGEDDAAGIDGVGGREDDGAFDDVAELADVAGVVVGREEAFGLGGEADDGLAHARGEALQEVAG